MFSIIPVFPVVLNGSTAYMHPSSTTPLNPLLSGPHAYDGIETPACNSQGFNW